MWPFSSYISMTKQHHECRRDVADRSIARHFNRLERQRMLRDRIGIASSFLNTLMDHHGKRN